ncbi:MAG: isocitrate/isopropylmalate dehydrogenase family protein [Candidatus Thorarchaeota archaeon]
MVRRYRIGVLPGDGIGREVIPESVRVLKRLRDLKGIDLSFSVFDCGGETYLKTGREWSPEAEGYVKQEADAVLLGAVGANHPDGSPVRLPDGNLAGYNVVIGLRMELDLYANVRPVRLFDGVVSPLGSKRPQDINMVIIRENTEGLYVPVRGVLQRGGSSEMAADVRIITRAGAERVIRFAFNMAARRNGAPIDGVRRVTCVDKSNLLAGCQLFRNVFKEVSGDYPDVQPDYAYVDSWMQWCVRTPERFDVVVAPNEFGDIMTDLGAAIQGGMGIAPAGNIGDKHAVFEPVHGSAPSHYGKRESNPIASILAGAMMLDWLGSTSADKRCSEAATMLNRSVENVLKDGRIRTYDLCVGPYSGVRPSSTDQVTDAIIDELGRLAESM